MDSSTEVATTCSAELTPISSAETVSAVSTNIEREEGSLEHSGMMSSSTVLSSSYASTEPVMSSSLPDTMSALLAVVVEEESNPTPRSRAATTDSPSIVIDKRRLLSASMLRASGERFIAVRSNKQSIIVKSPMASRLRRSSLGPDSSDRSSSTGGDRSRKGSREQHSETSEEMGSVGDANGAAIWHEADEGSDAQDEECDEEDEEDEEEDGDDEDDDFLLDSNEEITLELAINAQRLGAIAAILRKVEAGQTERAMIPALTGSEAAEHGGPGGTPLHYAATLPDTFKRRDKVFEYLLNYSVKHRQRKEDEEGSLPDPLDTAHAYAVAIGRKRKQSYLRAGEDEGADPPGKPPIFIPSWQWIDAPNHEGDTALHVAATKGYLFAVNILLQDGRVDPDISNDRGALVPYYPLTSWYSITSCSCRKDCPTCGLSMGLHGDLCDVTGSGSNA